jgi:tetratricopeptide (TPR) repeat protein
MTLTHATFCILTALISGAAVAQHTESGAADHPGVSSVAAIQSGTPAQARIAAAKQQLKADPKKVQAYNELAIAFMTRARETADPRYLKDADAALVQGLGLDPSNFQLQRTQVALMLSRHEYAQARERAAALNHRTPDDVMTYGYIAEADIALGNYSEAETNAQWMLNMRPNNIPGLLIGAKLRTLYGDTHGAIDFLNLAYSETSPTEVEDLAWIANQIASIQIESGQNDAAAQTLEQAAQIFPHYPYTIENLARVRMGQNRANDALQLWKQAATTDNDVAAAPAVMQTAVSDEPLTDAGAPNHTTVAADLKRTTAAPVFAPVPEALLTPHPTGSDHVIHNAQATIARNPNDATAYAGLGAAYFQRARETGDVSDYQLAEQSLTKSLDLVSADFSADAALGTMAEVCMGEHRFSDALTYAQRALSLGTGDVSPFAIVGDAYADMGEYGKAGVAYGRLTPRDMTLSPRAAYARDSRISYLKFIAGDTAGAISLMKTAVTEGVEAQLPSENLAWLYYELGEYETQAGDSASADAAYMTALNIHPGDYRALAALGKLRANNGRYAEAIVLYEKAIAIVPMPIFVAELGDLYAKSGNQVEAQKEYALVEYIGLLGHINQVLHNRDLALFYADHDMKLAEALDLAQNELEVRHDVYTLDALAWALYKNGRLTEAAQASEKAMRFGTRDSLLLFHAGMIAERMGQPEQARNELKEALQINPHFHLIYANAAQQSLTALEAQSESKEGSE